MADCEICYTNVKKTKTITCPNCNYNCCVDCIVRYFSELTEAICPSCLKAWGREFISVLHKDVYKCFTEMRERFLLHRELALMPETQVEIQRRDEIYKFRRYLNALYSEFRIVDKLAKKDKNSEELKNLSSQIYGRIKEVIREGLVTYQVEDENVVLFNCPTDGCRGFIRKKDYTCGICEMKICKKCNIILTDEHECKKEDIETAKMLTRETKPCPECYTSIFKIDGCDQMWCTQCKTPFSWHTGKKVFERIHNPHYYEWQRQMNGGVAPRVEGDNINIGGECHYTTIYQLNRCIPVDIKGDCIYKLHEFTGHMASLYPRNNPPNNLQLRIQYLEKDIDKEKFTKIIQLRDKKYQKQKELREIAIMFSQVCEEQIFHPAVSMSRIQTARHGIRTLNIDELDFFLKKADEIVAFTNEQFKIIAKKYKTKPKKIQYRKDLLRWIYNDDGP